MHGYLGRRAVVLGGSMAGLLSARVLSEHYQHVVVVERDAVIGVTQARRGVPQARHAHALLAAGQEVLEDLFPGLQAELTADGVLSGDLAGNIRWYFNGYPLAQAYSGLLSVSATRPDLEAHVRARVVAIPNVEIRQLTVVQGLEATADRGRITGVRVAGEQESAPAEVIAADLVIDATGRGSRAPAWLAELGYERPAEDKIKIDLAYVSRFFKLDSDPFGLDLAINPVASPDNPHGAFFGKFPGNVALLSLTGLLGDHPPRDPEGFIEFTRTLAAPEIYPAVRTAEPISDIAVFRVPASVRRRYDKMGRLPDGFLLLGDSVCSFNPVYGQGMTVAALEAAALAGHLREGTVRPVEFFREIKPVIDVPWDTSAGADLAFPGVEGPRTMQVKMGNAFIKRLHTAARQDGTFTRAFFRVAGLVDPPQALMKPGLIVGALRTARKVEKAGPAAGAATPIGERAVVLGGSIAGTLTARVLSEFYREVIVVDRDAVLGVTEPRRGAPHTGHAHGLHARGYLNLEELFPNLMGELQARGVPVGDLGEMRWFFNGKKIQPARTGLWSISAQRPVLEDYLRSRVAALPNVGYRERTELLGLLSSADHSRVTGVRLRDRAGSCGEYRLDADLVVDATGRGSRLPVWLEEMGYQRPAEDKMKIGLAYTTRLYKKRPEMFDGAQSINPVASPAYPRGAFFGQVSRDEAILSLTGILGDRPPTDPDGFLEFVRSLPVPDIYDAVKDAEPLTDPVTFQFPASVRRRYERLGRFPGHLLVVGDAFCSFNPVYGQGMTVASIQAMALRDHLRRYGAPRALEFLREVGKIINNPWEISTSGDLDFPGVAGPRPVKVKMGNAYMARLQYAATKDPAITDAFMRVAGLMDPPTALMRPRLLARTLRLSRHMPPAPAPVPVPVPPAPGDQEPASGSETMDAAARTRWRGPGEGAAASAAPSPMIAGGAIHFALYVPV